MSEEIFSDGRRYMSSNSRDDNAFLFATFTMCIESNLNKADSEAILVIMLLLPYMMVLEALIVIVKIIKICKLEEQHSIVLQKRWFL